MNKQELISLIEQPEQLGKSHITALKQIAADFPYFQTAHVLLTKAFYNDHHYEFEKQLKHTALLVPDRTVLFRYIHNLSDHQQAPEVLIPETVNIETSNIIEEVTPIISLPVSPMEITITAPPPVVEPETSDLVTEEILHEVVEEIIEPEAILAPEITEPIILPIEEPELEITTEESFQEIKPFESHSFTEWLQLQQGKKMIMVETPKESTLHTEELSPSETIVNFSEPETLDKTPIETEIAEQVKRSNVNDFESILDKFIRENPRISRGKAEFYNPVNMAKQSVEENDEIVTETLANVYYKQGHYKKAIRAYEKLCLIYPHKMTYFASLIQKIKTETKE